MSVNRAKATKDEGFELGGTHAGLASTSLDDAVNEKVIHLEEDNAAIFFRTHLSDIKLLKDPAISAIRRNSIRSMISESEFNSLNEAELLSPEYAIKTLSKDIFTAWDISGDGFLTPEEISVCSGLDQDFSLSLSRVLGKDNADGNCNLQSLTECIRVLKNGILEEKVRLLFTFMDSDRSGVIDYSEVKQYLKIVGEQGLERLGFVSTLGKESSLNYEQLLALFQKSVRGEAAISIFCDQVLQLLSKRILKRTPSRYQLTAEAVSTCSESALSSIKQLIAENSSKEKLYIYALVLLQIMFWLINFFYYQRTRHMPLAFCIAKGFGLNLRVITLALYFSMMRRTMGWLYTYGPLQPFLPMGFNIQVHSFLGFSLVLHALGHMLGHIAYHEVHAERGFAGTFQQESILRTGSWARRGKGDAITGYILLCMILLMAGTALYRGKSSSHFRAFFLVHYLYNLWPVFIFLHVPDLWPYFLAITGAIVLERAYDFLHMTIFSTLASSRACSNGVTFLSVTRRRETYPGSYYRIKVPAISSTEWHPFSLASGVSSHHLTFFVASAGDWTKELYRIVSDETLRRETRVMVQGPFYAPAKTATKFRSKNVTLLVASGIGITPFFSVMATKVADEFNYESDKDIYKELFKEDMEHRGGSVSTVKAIKNFSLDTPATANSDLEELRVVWMIRDCSELLFYLGYVHQLVKSQSSLSRHVVFVDVYLTGLGRSSDPVHMVSQTLFMLTVSDLTSKYMNVHFGRPDMPRIFKGIKPDQVYYCGGAVMQNVLSKLCLETGAHFHPEDFDAGTSFVPGIERYFSSLQKEAARQTIKREAIKRRNSMSEMNGAPSSPRARLGSGAPSRSREGSVGSVRSDDGSKLAQQTAAPETAVQAEADAMSALPV